MPDDISRETPDPFTTPAGTTSGTSGVISPPDVSGEAGSSTPPRASSPSSSSPSSSSPSTAETAKGEAQNVASQAAQSGGEVLETAKGEASEVIAHAGHSARTLFEQVRGELSEQAGSQQQRIAGGLHDLADELKKMGDGSQQPGLATSLVKQASDRARSTGDWMKAHEPGDLLAETQRFAARKPGTFLAAAAVLGFLGARLTRGLTAGNDTSTGTVSAPDNGPARLTAAPAGSYGDPSSLAPASAPGPGSVVGGEDDLVVPTVTTISHGEPVTYSTGAAGQRPSTVPPSPGTPLTGGTEGTSSFGGAGEGRQ